MSVTWELGALQLLGLYTGLQVGLQVFESLCRYSAWTGLWLCRTLMASSTVNHFLFLPASKKTRFLVRTHLHISASYRVKIRTKH